MRQIIDSVYNALENQNWYAALFVSLTLPDICASLEYSITTGSKYANWFEEHLPRYKGFLSGNDCYALRCALLHQGTDDISDQKKREMLDHYVFLSEGGHCNLFKDCGVNGENTSLLHLNVQDFCRELCKGVENWLISAPDDSEIQRRLSDTIEIHKPGCTYKGIIRFG